MSMDVYECDPVEASLFVIRRARKNHVCEACDSTIERTHLYEVISGIDHEKQPFRIKRCLRCKAIAEEISSRLDYDEGIAFRLDCGHDWEERFDSPPPDDVAALAFMTQEEAQKKFGPNAKPSKHGFTI